MTRGVQKNIFMFILLDIKKIYCIEYFQYFTKAVMKNNDIINNLDLKLFLSVYASYITMTQSFVS